VQEPGQVQERGQVQEGWQVQERGQVLRQCPDLPVLIQKKEVFPDSFQD
jgi:hypothetical protein